MSGRVATTLVTLLLMAVSTVLVVRAQSELGATFDEPFYVAKGLESWRTGSNRALMTAGTMPLPVDAVTLPIFIWEQWRGTPFHPVDDFATILPVARLGTLPFWWLLMAYAALWGHSLAREWGAVFAVSFVAFEPNLLAHAALVTTDIAATATILASAYHFHVGRAGTTFRRNVIPGIWFAISLSTKASALAYGPILFTVLGVCHLARPKRWGLRDLWHTTTDLRRDLVWIGLIGLAGMLVYAGSDWRVEPTFVTWAEQLPPSRTKPILQTLANTLAIFPNGLEGLVQQVKHNSRGHGAYILGEYHPRAVWYYFPVALSAKLPMATLILLLGTLVTPGARARCWPLGWCALGLLVFSLTCRVQIGIRLIFPLVVILNAMLASAWPPTRTGVLVRLLTLAGIILETLSAGAGRLPFTNWLYGGPGRTHHILADSNCDWGQGLPELAAWHTTTHDANAVPLYVWYYGADPAILLHPFHVKMVHTWPDPTPERLTRETANGLIAVSFSLLDASPDRRPQTVALTAWLKQQTPTHTTDCFQIYRLTSPGR